MTSADKEGVNIHNRIETKKGCLKMPRIFKTLASIVAWILFVLGSIGVIHFYVTAAMG